MLWHHLDPEYKGVRCANCGKLLSEHHGPHGFCFPRTFLDRIVEWLVG